MTKAWGRVCSNCDHVLPGIAVRGERPPTDQQVTLAGNTERCPHCNMLVIDGPGWTWAEI